jgi:hypothetical protein
VTRARLRELLRYDPHTGEFRWLERRNGRVRADAIAGTLADNGYRLITLDFRQYRAHQLAWFYMTGEWCPQVIDHRDGDTANNRWKNLRSATLSQSNANRRLHRNNSCGLKGVSRNRSRWRATIHKNRQKYELGTFPTPQAAHAAYVKAARKLFGEFARTK